MHTRVLALALAAALPAAAPAHAFKLDWGVTITSDYIREGKSQSGDGAAIQPWVEMGIGGAYAGLRLSNVERADDDIEARVSLGFRGQSGSARYDVGYDRYIYDDTGNCCGEFTLGLSTAATDRLTLDLGAAWDPERNNGKAELGAAYALNPALSVSGSLGRSETYDHAYWDVGVNYALGSRSMLGLRYHDTGTSEGSLGLSLTLGGSLTGR